MALLCSNQSDDTLGYSHTVYEKMNKTGGCMLMRHRWYMTSQKELFSLVWLIYNCYSKLQITNLQGEYCFFPDLAWTRTMVPYRREHRGKRGSLRRDKRIEYNAIRLLLRRKATADDVRYLRNWSNVEDSTCVHHTGRKGIVDRGIEMRVRNNPRSDQDYWRVLVRFLRTSLQVEFPFAKR